MRRTKRRDTPRAQTNLAGFQPRKMEEEDDDDEEVELHNPGSFSFGAVGGGAAQAADGGGTVDPFSAVGMLWNL